MGRKDLGNRLEESLQSPFAGRRSRLLARVALGAFLSIGLGLSAAQAESAEPVESASRGNAPQAKKDSSEGITAEKEGIREGFSVRESMLLGGSSRWTTLANTGLSRTLDELGYTTWTTGGTLGYRLSDNDVLNTSIAYQARTEFEDADPDQFGFTDLNVQWTRRTLWRHPNVGAVSSAVSWRLPTSNLSQRITQYSSVTGTLSLRRPMPVQSPLRNLTLIGNFSTILALHQYEENYVRATDWNSPFGVLYSAGANYMIIPQVNVAGSYSMYHRVDYQGFVQDIQTVTAQAVVSLPEGFFLAGGYQWRDRVVTNDPVLFADKTAAFVDLSRAF